jgi:hypothetical protein
VNPASQASADRLILRGIAALVIGLSLTGHGCARFVGGGGHVFGAEVAEGRVVDVRTRQADFGRQRGLATVHEVVVEFPADGRAVRIEDATGATGAEHDKGSTVKVYYDPAAPHLALIGGTAPFSGIQYVIEWLFGVATLIVAGMLMVRAAGRNRNAKESR